MSPEKKDAEQFTDEEARRRFEATLRGALKTPPQKRDSEKEKGADNAAPGSVTGRSSGSAQSER